MGPGEQEAGRHRAQPCPIHGTPQSRVRAGREEKGSSLHGQPPFPV